MNQYDTEYTFKLQPASHNSLHPKNFPPLSPLFLPLPLTHTTPSPKFHFSATALRSLRTAYISALATRITVARTDKSHGSFGGNDRLACVRPIAKYDLQNREIRDKRKEGRRRGTHTLSKIICLFLAGRR